MVFEFKPKIDWNKGKALVWLLQALGLDEQDDVFTIYIGDDTTDEDAFEVFHTKETRKGARFCVSPLRVIQHSSFSCELGEFLGAGIVVTEKSMTTGASFTLHDTNEVRKFLEKLIDFGKAKH